MNIQILNHDVLLSLKRRDAFSDITLVAPSAEKTEFKLHKIVLSASSKYFEDHLAKNPTDDKIILPIPAIPDNNKTTSQAPVYRSIFDAVYSNKSIREIINNGLSADNCFLYYSIADSLQFVPLKNAISEYIAMNVLNPSNLSSLLTESTKLEIPEVQDKCMTSLLQDFGRVINSKEQSDRLLRLPFQEFYTIITSDAMSVDSEDSIFDLVIKYIEMRETAPLIPADDSKLPDPLKTPTEDPEAPTKDAPPVEPPKPADPESKPPEDLIPVLPMITDQLDFAKKAEEKMRISPLTVEQKKKLLLGLRFKFISHEKIMRESKHPLLVDFRDILLEGLSAKLKNFEPNSLIYSINTKPRDHYTSLAMSSVFNHASQMQNPDQFQPQKSPQSQSNNKANNNHFSNIAKHANKLSNSNGSQPRIDPPPHVRLNQPPHERIDPPPHVRLNNEYERISGIPQGSDSKLPPGFMDNFQQDNRQFPGAGNPYADFEKKYRNEVVSNAQRHEQGPNPSRLGQSHTANEIALYSSNHSKQGFGAAHNTDTDSAYGDSSSELAFNYKYDFDENGALYFLGTLGKTTDYTNPYSLSLVKVFFSSMGKGSYEDFVGRSLVNCRTLNEPNAFMGIDLGQERYIIPSCYTIRNRDSSRHIMMNWLFEGSIDFKTWFILDKRIHKIEDPSYNKLMEKERQMIDRRGATSTWAVDQNYLKGASRSIVMQSKAFHGFRFFRIKQISKNSSGADNLALSGFEIYGIAKGANWKLFS